MNNIIFKAMVAITSILVLFLCSSCMVITANEKSTKAQSINNAEEQLTMEVISEETWSWMLYRTADSYYLSVVCGSVGIFTRDFELSKEEIAEFTIKGIPFIKLLASQVRQAPQFFEKRHLHSFNNMQGVKEATEKWREENQLK